MQLIYSIGVDLGLVFAYYRSVHLLSENKFRVYNYDNLIIRLSRIQYQFTLHSHMGFM